MKFMIRLIIIILLFINFAIKTDSFFKTTIESHSKQKCDQNDRTFGKTFFSIRPQDSNSVRRIINLANNTKLFFDEENNFSINLTLEYQKTTNSHLLSKWFFFNDRDCMTIGTPVEGLNFDIDATQLGIGSSTGSVGTVCIKPEISNFIADFEIDIALDQILCGLWTRFSFPIVHETIKQNLSARPAKIDPVTFQNGLFNFCCNTTKSPFNCLLDAFEGNLGFGVVPKLEFAKFSNAKMKKTGLASIIFDLAYDFVRNDRTNFALGGHLVIPTGNEPKGKFILEPVIGANQSWQLGFVVIAMHDIYTPDLTKNISLFFDGTISHIFKSNQKRVFGLKDKPGSQFLLLKQFNTLGDVVDAQRLANVLLGETKIGANIMIDSSIMMQIKWCNYFMNLGYNFWYRSKEKKDDKILFNNFIPDTFALKGDLLLSNRSVITECPLVEECIPVNTTASKSTISRGAKADEDQVFIKLSDIDYNVALHPDAYSNKFFTSFGFHKDCCRYSYSAQLGAEIEIGKNAIDQWGIFFNAGLIF